MEFLPLLLLFGILYVVSIRPQRKRAQEAQLMLGNLAIDDDIITIGGIYGRVVDMDTDHVDIVVSAGGTVLRITKGAIAKVVPDDVESSDDESSDDEFSDDAVRDDAVRDDVIDDA